MIYYVVAAKRMLGQAYAVIRVRMSRIPQALVPMDSDQKHQSDIGPQNRKVVWEVPQPGPAKAKTWSGVLATAGGLVFYGQPNGGFAAVDERDGKTLWQFPTCV
jgi:glucose dehydrogenase